MDIINRRRVLAAIIVMAAATAACAAPGGAATTAPTESVEATEAPTEAATQEGFEVTTPESSGSGARTVNAGQKMTVFSPYSVAVADGWTDNHQVVKDVVDTLLLTKGGVTLMISQAAGGGGECHFAGEGGEGLVFPGAGVGIKGSASEFMRGTTDNGANWEVCEKGPDTFGFPTTYGRIMYKGSAAIDDATLAEMDGMVASLAVTQ